MRINEKLKISLNNNVNNINIKMAQLINSKDETNDFLNKLVHILLSSDKFHYVIPFRAPDDEIMQVYEPEYICEKNKYMDYEEIKQTIKYKFLHEYIYNYKEYSNLPQTGYLYTTLNIVHNGNYSHIYGYLDEKTKSFIKFESEYPEFSSHSLNTFIQNKK